MIYNEIKIAKNDDLKNKVSDHFTLKEVVCKCGCNQYILNSALLVALETLRRRAQAELLKRKNMNPDETKIIIDCWCRCERHNESVGGEKGSYHLLNNGCLAVDLKIKNKNQLIEPKLCWKFAEDCSIFNGLGIYGWGIHVDIRPFDYYNRWIHVRRDNISLSKAS